MRFGCMPRENSIGVLFAQVGTPDAPTPSALRRYLKQFLSDRRVIEKNRVLWWLILNGIILNVRPARSAALYKNIWTKEGSPLLTITKKQSEMVQERLSVYGVEVAFGMRYGNPSLEVAYDELIRKGCKRILLFPLYPQYAAATTGTTYDAVFSLLLKHRWVPTLRVVDPYFVHPEYLAALAASINDGLANLAEPPERLVLTYHGIPLEYVEKGDPYCCQCVETTQHLIPNINLPKDSIIHTFQSRFGRDPWLEPYTDKTIEALPKQGVTSIAVACPGFAADCLETIDEMGREVHHAFLEEGGKKFALIPCLNDHPRWIEALTNICKNELADWLEADRGSVHQASCQPKCPANANCKGKER
jgi:ferrochelatase